MPLVPLALGDVLGGPFATTGRGWKQLYGTAVAVCLAAALLVGGGHGGGVLGGRRSRPAPGRARTHERPCPP
ncbi:hypothetical protein ACFWY7_30465, partial [Streptomyces sp. NPDC059001]